MHRQTQSDFILFTHGFRVIHWDVDFAAVKGSGGVREVYGAWIEEFGSGRVLGAVCPFYCGGWVFGDCCEGGGEEEEGKERMMHCWWLCG